MRKATALFILVFLVAGAAWAGDVAGSAAATATGTTETASAGQAVVDANNALCPVCGKPVSGKDFAEAKGMRYGVCCAMCADQLKANPDQYLKEGEVAAEKQAQ